MHALINERVGLLGTPSEKGNPSRWRSRKSMIAVAVVVAMLLVTGVSLLLTHLPTIIGPAKVFGPRIDRVSLSSQGLVSFQITNVGTETLTFTQVNAYRAVGTNMTYLASVSVTSNNVLPYAGTLSLSVQFQNITWQPADRYHFVLMISAGFSYGFDGCLNGC